MDRRWRGFGREHVLVSNAYEWLLGKGRAEVRADTFDDPARRATQSWISLVASVRKSGGRGLAENCSAASRQILVGRSSRGAELEEPFGVVVLGQQSEEYAPPQHERWRILVPSV